MTIPYQSDKLFIGGKWVEPDGKGRFEVISPSTEEVIGYAPSGSVNDIDRAVQTARNCFDNTDWPQLSFEERARLLNHAADIFDRNIERVAEVTAHETGLPYHGDAMNHARLIGHLFRTAADVGLKLGQEEERPGLFTRITVRREPVGVVAAITPWNGPSVMAHFTIPLALMAGCTVVLKPAPEPPLHGQLLGSIYEEIGLPPGVINIVPADREVSEALVRHPGVDKVVFTGSTATGQRIGMICGELFKRRTLELGGKSAAIILDDANLPEIMPDLVKSSVMNNCQACLGQTRILAPESRYDEIVDCEQWTGLFRTRPILGGQKAQFYAPKFVATVSGTIGDRPREVFVMPDRPDLVSDAKPTIMLHRSCVNVIALRIARGTNILVR